MKPGRSTERASRQSDRPIYAVEPAALAACHTVVADQVRSLLGDHDRRAVRVATNDCWHDGRIDDPQALDPMDAEAGIDDQPIAQVDVGW